MNKTELVAAMAEQTNLSKKDVEAALKAFIDVVAEELNSDACVSCGSCADSCPMGAISQGDSQYVIDANTCIDCGSCADTCPTGAISQG